MPRLQKAIQTQNSSVGTFEPYFDFNSPPIEKNRKMSKQNRVISVVLAVVVGFMSASVSNAATNGKLRIVYAVSNMAWPWNAAAAKRAREEAKRLDVELLIQDAEANSAKQSSELRDAIVQGVDGIMIAPVDVSALVPAVDDVNDARIPVVTVDRRIGGTKEPVSHFGLDNVMAGEAMAQYVVNKFPHGAKVVFLTGQPGSSSATERITGVHKALAAAGDKYQIVAEQTANWARAEALRVTQNILTSLHYTPDAVISSNDDMAMGALQAIQEAGIAGDKILVVGCDTLPEALADIRDGRLAASVEYPLSQVTIALDALVQHLRDKTPLSGKILDPKVIERTNMTSAERWNEVK
jgi:inositol transport system substrate-binding protein